jgi:hypothetical protein
MLLFGSGYMLMLLAMYYNGGIILTIFVAAFVGHFLTAVRNRSILLFALSLYAASGIPLEALCLRMSVVNAAVNYI